VTSVNNLHLALTEDSLQQAEHSHKTSTFVPVVSKKRVHQI